MWARVRGRSSRTAREEFPEGRCVWTGQGLEHEKRLKEWKGEDSAAFAGTVSLAFPNGP